MKIAKKLRVSSCLAALWMTWCPPGYAQSAAPAVQSPADLWTSRLFAIPSSAKAAPTVIGIWDNGVDLSLFQAAPGRGIGFDANGKRSDVLLLPLGEAAQRWPQIKQALQGAADLKLELRTPAALQLRKKLKSLDPAAKRAFIADLNLASQYVHGTIVATAATNGNPFARVFATLEQESEDPSSAPTVADVEDQVRRIRDTVKAFRDAKVRVVNISFGVSPELYDSALEEGGHSDEAARRTLARKLYDIHRRGMLQAMASAPEILFVAGARGSDHPEQDAEFIPAALQLPNLLTVGAVNSAGEATDFSSFGAFVAVHANGYRVASRIPGGDPIVFSGASIACPQVTNLAAKLLALKPTLDVAALKALILDGAELRTTGDGRHELRLLNPRKSLQLAGLPPP